MTRTVLRWVVGICVGVGILSSPNRTLGGPPPADGINIMLFEPSVSSGRYETVYGAQTPGHLAYGVGFVTSYQRRPFVLHVSNQGDPLSGRTETLVDNLVMAQVFGFVGVTKYLSIGLSMPMGLYVSGQQPDSDPTEQGAALNHFAWGDAGIHLQGFFYRLSAAHLSFGAVLSLFAPTGKYSDSFLGAESLVLQPRVTAEFSNGPWSTAVNLGGLFRPQPVSFYDGAMKLGQQFSFGMAGSYLAARIVRLFVELTGRTDFRTLEASPMEAGLGARIKVYRGLSAEVGANAGILAGIGTPQFRLYTGLRWVPIAHDSDGDGVDDDLDQCPGQLEDKDGFQDEDGCPDPDNDRDLIPDERDRCPNQPEDYDNFMDTDGCPDPDNDGDGVCDDNPVIQDHMERFSSICKGKDNCPMDKGATATSGCPASMLDEDGDGVPDSRDRCPKRPEDKDGFEDADGCPDPDNDKDGLCDSNEAIQGHLSAYKKICHGKDACDNKPEDRDGFQDQDGCPDPDDDADGVCDSNPQIQAMVSDFKDRCIGRDRCPKKKETINGVRDDDGCPDRGRPDARLSGNEIVLRGHTLRFKGDTTTMKRGSNRVLAQIAAIMRTHREIKKLVIVGFTDSLLPKEKALALSESWARAVADALSRLGIPRARMLAKGLGAAKPKYLGKNRRKQVNINRRVELFVIR